MDVEQYIRNLPWSERATDHEKALVEGNLRGFYAEMQKATQPLFDAAVAIELQIDEQTLAERDTRPPPPEPKIMGEEVEEKRCDILEEIRDAKDGYVTRSDLIAIMSDAGKQIESLRASLTRVEEERDALTKERNGMGGALVIAAERLRVAASRVDRADTEFGFRQWAEEAERASDLSRDTSAEGK